MAQPTVTDTTQYAINAEIDRGGDPYSAAAAIIANTLEVALDDGITDGMSQKEFDTLDAVARFLCENDPGVEINPRVA